VGFRRVTTRAQAKAASKGDYAGSDSTPPAADVATSNSMGAARRNGRNKQAVQPIEITQLWSTQHIREQQLNDARIGPVLKAVEAGTSSAELTNSPDREVQCYLRQWASMIVQNGVLYRT
jgi:hypothetical protein